jgi:hypothetical protein
VEEAKANRSPQNDREQHMNERAVSIFIASTQIPHDQKKSDKFMAIYCYFI